MAEEKIYTVPLRREFLKVPKYKRYKKAMKALKEFLKKHLKEDVKIGKYLNEEVSKRRKNPPGKIKIRIEGEKGKYKAELIDAPREEIKKEEKKKEEIKKPELPKEKKREEKVEEKKEPKKVIEKKEEPKKEEKKIEIKENSKNE